MASAQILREYLIALGFKVNTRDERVFDTTVKKANFNVMGLAKGVAAAGAATAAFVTLFTRGMEKAYYASRLAESTVGNLKAMDFGARSIGLGADSMAAAVQGMARAMRLNPGLEGLVEAFGVKVSGRDKADVALDFVDALKRIPFYEAAAYANMFGIDPDTLLLLIEGVDKMREAAALRKKMAEAAGVDADAAARASIEYQDIFRRITEKMGLLKDATALALLPSAKEFAAIVEKTIDRITAFVNNPSQKIQQRLDSAQKMGWSALIPDMGIGNKLKEWFPGGFLSNIGKGKAGPAGASNAAPKSLFASLETDYGLPMGLLDKIWAKESGRGRNMLSKAGAQGHFQFMPGTAKRFGLDDPNDLTESATAAAKYMQLLLERYDGDIKLATMAYNAGEGRIDNYLAGRGKPLAAETVEYGNHFGSIPFTMHQQTTINMNGTGDPVANARAVGAEQSRVNTDMASVARNRVGALR